MAAQPSEDDIEMMTQMSGIERTEAILRLKGNNNDLTQAVNEFFENPDSSRYTWDDSQFSSDRDGANQSGVSFQVQSPDDPGASGYYSTAPSRPPSRTSNKSPNDRVISLAAEHAAADPRNSMSRAEIEDSDLQKALAQSAQEAGLAPQEYGIADTDMPHFGPANRPYYEQGKWDLVLPNTSVKELGADPEAADRKREEGKPAFLKPSVNDHRLAAILTIYHEIPLARELFLCREHVLPDYGHDSEWWTGKAIQLTKPAPWEEKNMLEDEEVVAELQRLMAFLDKTERSYGSAEVLANLGIVKRAPIADIESKFFSAWKDAHQEDAMSKSIFSHAIQPRDTEGNHDPDEDDEDDEITFAILDLVLPNADDPVELETLYDLADQALWSSSELDLATSAYLSHVADIVSFRITGQESSRHVKIPAVWYSDRYIEANKAASLEMRKEKVAIREKVTRLSMLENKMTFVTLPQGKVVKVRDLFNAAAMHDSEVVEYTNSSDASLIDAEATSKSHVGNEFNISIELEKVMASIDDKLNSLNDEKDRARDSLRELSKLYAGTSQDAGPKPAHRYTLRGVSTSKDVLYLRRQAEPDLIDMEVDVTDSNTNSDDWWKIDFGSSSIHAPDINKVTQQEVLAAAVKEGQTTIVVYASDQAMAEPMHPLPEALEAFVRADNLAFSAEFPEDQESPQPQNEIATPKSPAKRKYQESSEETAYAEQESVPAYTSEEHQMIYDQSHVTIKHRELAESVGMQPSAEEIWDTESNSKHDIIMGQDPNELIDMSMSIPESINTEMISQEMQTKDGLPSLIANVVSTEKRSMLEDDMDIEGRDADERQPNK